MSLALLLLLGSLGTAAAPPAEDGAPAAAVIQEERAEEDQALAWLHARCAADTPERTAAPPSPECEPRPVGVAPQGAGVMSAPQPPR